MENQRRAKSSKLDVVGGLFFAMPLAVIYSAQYRGVSSNATRLLLDIAAQHNRKNNGALVCCNKYLDQLGWNSNDTIYKAKCELLEAGLLIETRKGKRPNVASWYALGWLSLEVQLGLDLKPSSYRRCELIKFVPVVKEKVKPKQNRTKPNLIKSNLCKPNLTNPEVAKTDLIKLDKTAHSTIKTLTPPSGVEPLTIAPPHDVDTSPTTPPHGAITGQNAPAPTPPYGECIDKPSVIALDSVYVEAKPLSDKPVETTKRERDCDQTPDKGYTDPNTGEWVNMPTKTKKPSFAAKAALSRLNEISEQQSKTQPKG